jgi:Holliday junction resolvase
MNNKHMVNIIKSSGVQVPFSRDKLCQSLKRSGANEQVIQDVANEVEALLYEGIDTKTIFRNAFRLLKKKSRHTAAKYKLKQAIMELGPTGFPFEKFISEILKYQGYKTIVGEIVQGKCVTHEIDVIAEKDNEYYMIECKYHNQRGIKCNVKTPLYIQARFQDVEQNWKKLPGHEEKKHRAWVVTNTQFSQDAIQYGQCVGLYLMSWDFPEKESLKDRISLSGLFPLTCMTTLTSLEKQKLIDKNIILCAEIVKTPQLLTQVGIPAGRINNVLREAMAVSESLQQTEKI